MRWGRWFDARWYAYLWQRSGPESKVYAGLLLLALLGAGGFYLASIAGSAHAARADAYIVRRTAVIRTVVQVAHGRPVVKEIREVRTVKLPAKAVTVRSLHTMTERGRVTSVPVTSVKYVPLTKATTATVERVVTTVRTRNGKTTTVVHSEPTTVATTVPVTVRDTETQSQTVTRNRTVTLPPATTTVLETTTDEVTVVQTTTRTRTVTVTVTTTEVVPTTLPTSTKS